MLHTIRRLANQTAKAKRAREGMTENQKFDVLVDKFTFINEIKDVFHGSIESFFHSNLFTWEFKFEGDKIKASNM